MSWLEEATQEGYEPEMKPQEITYEKQGNTDVYKLGEVVLGNQGQRKPEVRLLWADSKTQEV